MTMTNILFNDIGLRPTKYKQPFIYTSRLQGGGSGATFWNTTPSSCRATRQTAHKPYMVRVLVQPLEHHPTEPQGHQPTIIQGGVLVQLSGTPLQVLEHHPNFWNTTPPSRRAPAQQREHQPDRAQHRSISPHLHEGALVQK